MENKDFSKLCLSIRSATRYWWSCIFGAKTAYGSWWFEGLATQLCDQYIKLHGANVSNE